MKWKSGLTYDDDNPIHCHLFFTYAANKIAEKAAYLSISDRRKIISDLKFMWLKNHDPMYTTSQPSEYLYK